MKSSIVAFVMSLALFGVSFTQTQAAGGHLGELVFTLPASTCRFSTSDSLPARCNAQNVALSFAGDTQVAVTAQSLSLNLWEVETTSVDGSSKSLHTAISATLPSVTGPQGAVDVEFDLDGLSTCVRP